MANLLGQNIGTNYKGILNLDTINTPLDATLKAVTDGEGNASPLQLSTDEVSVGAISGARLGIKGSGTTASTNALLVENSAGQTLLKANDNRNLYLGSSNSNYIHQGIFFQGNYYGVGNWMFGTVSDLGARLGIKGSGSTSSTTALLVQNSAGTDIIKAFDNGSLNIGFTTNTNNPYISMGGIYGGTFINAVSQLVLRIGGTDALKIDGNGNIGIGNPTIAANTKLHIKGSGTTSGTTSLLVQDSAGTNLFRITDDGAGYFGNSQQGLTGNNITLTQYFISAGSSGNCFGTFSGFAASAIVQCESTTRGFLPPRMTTTQKNAIATPASGLIVYDTTTNKLACYNGTTWNDLF